MRWLARRQVLLRMTRGLKRGSVQRTGIEPRRSPADLEQMAQDPAYLRDFLEPEPASLHRRRIPAMRVVQDREWPHARTISRKILLFNERADP